MKKYCVFLLFFLISYHQSCLGIDIKNSWNNFVTTHAFNSAGNALALGSIIWGVYDFYSAYKKYTQPINKKRTNQNQYKANTAFHQTMNDGMDDLHRNFDANEKLLKESTVSQKVTFGLLKCCSGFVLLATLFSKKI